MKPCGMQNQISLYLDGQLAGEALRRFEDHLQKCGECADEVEQMQQMLHALKALPEREVPAGLTDRLHAALVQEATKGTVRVKRRFNPWVAVPVAAALVVFVAGGALLLGGMGTSSNQKNAILYNSATGLTGSAGGAEADQRHSEENGFAPMASAAAALAPEEPAGDASLDIGDVSTAKSNGYRTFTTDDKQQNNAVTSAQGARKMIYTATMALETRQFDTTLTTLQDVMAKYGGYVQRDQVSGVPEGSYGSARSASYTMRFPITNYADAVGDLAKMGNLLNRNESVEDISRQYVDTDARNKALTLQRDRLYELLTKADKMENIIVLENEITRLTTEIEQMTAQLHLWDDQVAYSTVTVNIQEILTPKAVEPADPDLNTRRNGAFSNTINRMRAGLEEFTVSFMGALPWLIIVLAMAAVALGITWPLVRRARRHAKSSLTSKEE